MFSLLNPRLTFDASFSSRSPSRCVLPLPSPWADTWPHHPSPSPSPFLLFVRTAQPQKPPSRTAEAQRRYRHRNTISSCPDADARHSRETTLYCKCQAQVHAHRSALQYPPTTDSGPDEIVGRDHGPDPHRLRQTEYHARLRLHHTNRMSRLQYRPLPTTPCRLTFLENVPLPIPAFLHPIFVPTATGSTTPMQTVCSGLTHSP